MAEEKKEGLLDQAASFIKDQAGDLLSGDTTDIKKQASEIGKKIMPDALDDKVDDVVNTAVDFLKDTLERSRHHSTTSLPWCWHPCHNA